ncbi:MAG: hypothetical protein NT169_19305 [Chloroflexi bacterium]|nr:hypothetical protein [Chloroflexota bacterium]
MDKLPTMSRVEEGKFWETRNATDYLDATQPVSVTVGPRPRNRCPKCEQTLLSRYVDVSLADGRAQLRGLRQLYCPDGHETRLAPEAQRLVDAIEAVLHLTWVPIGASQMQAVA